MSITSVLTACPLCKVRADHKFIRKTGKYKCSFCFGTWTTAQLMKFLNERQDHHHHVVIS